LKAGVLEEDGRVEHPATGSPQGGVISPVLANVYLHYVMDLCFHRVVVKRCRGEACLIRYADDVVCAFERAEDASWFMGELKGRAERFGLELSPEKTRRIEFLREAEPGRDDGPKNLRALDKYIRTYILTLWLSVQRSFRMVAVKPYDCRSHVGSMARTSWLSEELEGK
jgi:hypothetical protein